MKPETEDPNLKQVTENMSEVNPDVIRKQEKPETPPPSVPPAPKAAKTAGKEERDRQGRSFDPSLHEVDAWGNPKLNRDGFLAGKPGRPGKGEKTRFQKEIPSGGEEASAASQKTISQNQNMAKITTAIFIKLGVGVFGDEWYPQKYTNQDLGVTIDEQAEMIAAFDQYFRSKNMTDLTPGWALVLSLSGYAAARMTQPKTQSRFKIIAGRVLGFASKIFSKFKAGFKKQFKGVKIASQFDSRTNGERKDDLSAKASETVQGAGNSGSGS